MKSPNHAETILALAHVSARLSDTHVHRWQARVGGGMSGSCGHGSLNAFACNSGNSELATTRLLGLKAGWLCLKVKDMVIPIQHVFI